MKHFAATIIVIIIIVLVIIFAETKFVLPKNPLLTTITTTTSQGGSTTTNASSTTTAPSQLYPCSSVFISSSTPNSTTSTRCLLTSNALGIWAAAGNNSYAKLLIVGKGNITYINQTITYNCIAFFKKFTGPMQAYNITFTTGGGGGSCGPSILKLNSTTSPPSQVYSFVYNGNFSNGEYTGWNVTGAGFGTAPLNLTYADNAIVKCYVGSPWSNIPGTYVASTYSCGLQASPGNLTSSPFTVAKPFLNFKIISKPHANLYMEILAGNSPAIIAVYNTYNLSLPGGDQSASTFRNASIPLTSIAGKVAKIRIVAGTPSKQNFILAGGFYLSTIPNQQSGILTNLTIYNTT